MTPKIANLITLLVNMGMQIRINSITDKDVIWQYDTHDPVYSKNITESVCKCEGINCTVYEDPDRIFGYFYQ